MLKIVDGDLLKAKEKYIIHQVNCRGVMGSGVAKQIKDKYPKAFEEYIKICNKYSKFSKQLLGENQFVEIDEARTIINLFGQDKYGLSKRQTNYCVFTKAMIDIIFKVDSDIALPYKIGCDRGGANWSIIETILRGLAMDFTYDIVLYKYRK